LNCTEKERFCCTAQPFLKEEEQEVTKEKINKFGFPSINHMDSNGNQTRVTGLEGKFSRRTHSPYEGCALAAPQSDNNFSSIYLIVTTLLANFADSLGAVRVEGAP
jgi:hypothetical protein